jgi:hypothetical protein
VNKTPWGFKPSSLESYTINNGRPLTGNDAAQLDRFATWLATYKRNQPAMIGAPYVDDGASIKYYLKARFPQFTPRAQLWFQADGRGTITVYSGSSASSVTLDINNGTGSNPALGNAEWYAAPVIQMQSGSAGASSPGASDLYFELADASGLASLKVFAVKCILQPPEENEDLI